MVCGAHRPLILPEPPTTPPPPARPSRTALCPVRDGSRTGHTRATNVPRPSPKARPTVRPPPSQAHAPAGAGSDRASCRTASNRRPRPRPTAFRDAEGLSQARVLGHPPRRPSRSCPGPDPRPVSFREPYRRPYRHPHHHPYRTPPARRRQNRRSDPGQAAFSPSRQPRSFLSVRSWSVGVVCDAPGPLLPSLPGRVAGRRLEVGRGRESGRGARPEAVTVAREIISG